MVEVLTGMAHLTFSPGVLEAVPERMHLEILAQYLANGTPQCSVPSDLVEIKPLHDYYLHLVVQISPEGLCRFEKQFGWHFLQSKRQHLKVPLPPVDGEPCSALHLIISRCVQVAIMPDAVSRMY